MMLHVNSFIEPLASFVSRAEFHFYTRLLNEPNRANLLIDRALASQNNSKIGVIRD
jgi:hypothetical protein